MKQQQEVWMLLAMQFEEIIGKLQALSSRSGPALREEGVLNRAMVSTQGYLLKSALCCRLKCVAEDRPWLGLRAHKRCKRSRAFLH